MRTVKTFPILDILHALRPCDTFPHTSMLNCKVRVNLHWQVIICGKYMKRHSKYRYCASSMKTVMLVTVTEKWAKGLSLSSWRLHGRIQSTLCSESIFGEWFNIVDESIVKSYCVEYQKCYNRFCGQIGEGTGLRIRRLQVHALPELDNHYFLNIFKFKADWKHWNRNWDCFACMNHEPFWHLI